MLDHEVLDNGQVGGRRNSPADIGDADGASKAQRGQPVRGKRVTPPL